MNQIVQTIADQIYPNTYFVLNMKNPVYTEDSVCFNASGNRIKRYGKVTIKYNKAKDLYDIFVHKVNLNSKYITKLVKTVNDVFVSDLNAVLVSLFY